MLNGKTKFHAGAGRPVTCAKFSRKNGMYLNNASSPMFITTLAVTSALRVRGFWDRCSPSPTK